MFKGSLYPLVGKSGAPSCREGLRTGTGNLSGKAQLVRSNGRPVREPAGLGCVQDTPRGLQDDDLIASVSNLGQSLLTGSLYSLLSLEIVLLLTLWHGAKVGGLGVKDF